jgi:ribosomal protein S27E
VAKVVPLYVACIANLGSSDFVKLDCAGCSHTALIASAFLNRLGLSPRHKVLDLKDRVRCRGCGVRGRAVVSIKWGKSAP